MLLDDGKRENLIYLKRFFSLFYFSIILLVAFLLLVCVSKTINCPGCTFVEIIIFAVFPIVHLFLLLSLSLVLSLFYARCTSIERRKKRRKPSCKEATPLGNQTETERSKKQIAAGCGSQCEPEPKRKEE